MSLWLIILILIIAGIIAGLLSTIAGLASLVSYPTLLALGLPAVSANTTNTAALIFTGIGSLLSSSKELHGNGRITTRVSLVALCGGIVGALILAFAPESTFERVVPFLIFGAGILMLWSQFRKKPLKRTTSKPHPVKNFLRYLAIFLVGVYIGYFGASAGMILLAILIFTLQKNFAVTNAIKNFTTFVTNIMSIFIYAFTTKVYWWMVVPLGLGMFIGGYLGPVVVRHVPVQPIRTLIAFAAFGLAGFLFWQSYF
ncbi:sulfite exporter TauE/SafE family protein [Secundilactobacillus folii]|uniref:Probable membrane transporter protein n=1 Tax=Secundilactobacillus folii TaxID=2678357 RepID=A0A7X3C1L0_9LACO|nr:sulfite exporter TauE/SafE family protein [Secundilactobacillus folii]MTV81825.1 TSUP family transporter [Secundilactobacillus folii]